MKDKKDMDIETCISKFEKFSIANYVKAELLDFVMEHLKNYKTLMDKGAGDFLTLFDAKIKCLICDNKLEIISIVMKKKDGITFSKCRCLMCNTLWKVYPKNEKNKSKKSKPTFNIERVR